MKGRRLGAGGSNRPHVPSGKFRYRLLGGGTDQGPGEVSLAHHGVLFFDELPEFRRQALEVMRQLLGDGTVSISRAAGTVAFPGVF